MRTLNAIATFWVFCLMFLIVADVLGRTAFNNPLLGVQEIVKNSIVAICFLQIGHVLRENRHIRSTLIISRLPPLASNLLNVMANAVGLTLFILLCVGDWGLNWTAWVVKEWEGEGSLNVPTYPVRSIIFLGGALISIQFALNLYRSVKITLGTLRSRRAG